MQEPSKRQIVILDANAFISSNHLLNLGASSRLLTTADVMEELRDVKTRDMVKNLPFQIEVKQPSKKSLETVKEFARKTGDIGSLSDVDMGVIALTYTVYEQQGLLEKLRKNPVPVSDVVNQIAEESESDYSDQEEDIIQPKHQEQSNEPQGTKQQDDGWIQVPTKSKKVESDSDSDMDEDEGWVTPDNFKEKVAELSTNFKNEKEQEQDHLHVSLMSADYAVQNVATQMGIRLLSLDGRKISSLRRFVWECYLCWKQYKVDENKVKLCSNCGYNSLSKVAYSLSADGKMIMHRKKGWKPNQNVLQWKQKKYEEQEKRKKHQHPRKKKKPSIFETA